VAVHEQKQGPGSRQVRHGANLAVMSDTVPTHPTTPPADNRGDEPETSPTTAGDATPRVPQLIRDAIPGTLMERMGIDVVEASASRVVGTMPVAGNTQPYGLLHGGASVVLAESLGSLGAMLHAGEGRIAVGIEVSASHHRGAHDGLVTGTATAVHLGSTTAVYEVVVEDSRSVRVCTARLTCVLMAERTSGRPSPMVATTTGTPSVEPLA